MVRVAILQLFTLTVHVCLAQYQDAYREERQYSDDFIQYIKTYPGKADDMVSQAGDDKVIAIIPKHLLTANSKTYTHITRKEYRQMTEQELDIFHKCLQKMKDCGDYDALADLHDPVLAPAAHKGAAFLPWHRQMILTFEEIVRAYKGCESFFAPYWDSCLDEMLPRSEDSAVWSDQHWGTNNGNVETGVIGGKWIVAEKCQNYTISRKLLRVCDRDKGHILNRKKLSSLLSAQTYTELMALKEDGGYSEFELEHGLVHCFVSTCPGNNEGNCIGHLACEYCAANDPLFWLLHSFIDCLWHEWAELPGRENTYPVVGKDGSTFENIGKEHHLKYSPMSPFPGIRNLDGFRQNYYPGYVARPSLLRCTKDDHCNSPSNLLFCHNSRCCAKVRLMGNCSKLPHQACHCPKYGGLPKCLQGVCHCIK